MNDGVSVEQLAEQVNDWCEKHQVYPVNGQAGERITVRNIRYYRTLGLVDPPMVGGAAGFSEKHQCQLIAIRLLQAQGLPLNRIQELLFGRTLNELKEIEERGVEEVAGNSFGFRPTMAESWSVTPLNEEFMLVSRSGRPMAAHLRDRLLEVLNLKTNANPRSSRSQNSGLPTANRGKTKGKQS